jgi:hypothetical protein
MARYSVFSITGYSIFDGPEMRAPYGSGRRLHDPTTTWYVCDNAYCANVVGIFASEHEARQFQFKRNASERRWEKEQEYARNGHA